jgi:hypothetical protein
MADAKKESLRARIMRMETTIISEDNYGWLLLEDMELLFGHGNEQSNQATWILSVQGFDTNRHCFSTRDAAQE